MREQRWGRIVNVSSMGANFTFPGGGVYHATKYAVEAISDALRFEVKGFGVNVTVIQPGLIRTEFGATAAAAVEDGDGPYAAFNASVVKATTEVYEKGPLARLGGDAEDVARAIERAITRRSSRIRVRVTPSAHLLIAQRRMMSAGLWDRFLATQFPRPGDRG
jgi:short-subunit dehydrogenase